MSSANLRINRPVGFLLYFKPAFQFVTIVSGGDTPSEPFRRLSVSAVLMNL